MPLLSAPAVPRRLRPAFLAVTFCLLASLAWGAPRTPKGDAEILERLPFRASDTAARELAVLRREAGRQPGDLGAALALARRYFDLASAEGDPRYIGYAEALVRPWTARQEPPVDALFMRALLTQYRHDFAPAMVDLDHVLAREPRHAEALSWKWALFMVQARYAEARDVCERRRAAGSALGVTACLATIDSITGKAREAHAALSAALARDPDRDAEYRQWILTRLGEFAQRAGDATLAERHFREAIDTGVTDGYVLAAYADLLLDQKRPDEVIALLKNWVSSDILLLRLAIAERDARAPLAAEHLRIMAERFSDSALRGDRLHLQEEARFELTLRGNAARALELAQEDWKTQREPRDARVLMEVAIAAKQPAAARGALTWMGETGYQDPVYRALADTLEKMSR